MKEKKKIKIYTSIAILASLSSVISIFDKIIISCLVPYIPGIKLGLANVIVLYSIYNANFKFASIEVLLKITIVSFIFGSISSLIIGGVSSILSFLVMYILYRYLKNRLSIITISVVGGFIHINTQLIIIKLIYKLGNEVYSYGLILIIISFVTSIFVGLIARRINKSDFIHNIMH